MPDATVPTVAPRPRRTAAAALERWLPVALWVLAVLHALVWLDRGWFPHDLGSVAHPAQRVLLGELPHRDFDDVYTGGLAFLNALGFRLLGEGAMTARWVVLAAYAAWVPAVWAVARTFTGPWLAAAAALLATSWTLPLYAEGMPSWYILFLATASLWALLRFADGGGRRWLFWAGTAAGASLLFKITGLYTVAAGLLGLAWLEGARRPRGACESGAASVSVPGGDRRADALYRWFVAACSLSLAAVVSGLVARAMGTEGLVRFGVPALAAPLVLAWGARRATGVASRERFTTLLRSALPYAAGVAAALAPFLILYAVAGALDDLYRGVLVLPQRRLADASWPGLRGGAAGLTLAAATTAALAWAPGLRGRAAGAVAALAALAGAGALALSGVSGIYRVLWEGLWWLPPFVAGAGAVMLAGRTYGAGAELPRTHSGSDAWGDGAYLTLVAYGLASLVEIPFAAPIYFFFAAPLMVLLALALAGRRREVVPPVSSTSVARAAGAAVGAPKAGEPGVPRSAWLAGLVCFLLAFTVLRLAPGFVRHLGLQPARHDQTEALRIPRGGGLRVDAEAREEMEEVVGMVEALASGPYVYATPDAPEIYVLTGRRNPTRSLFEFLDPEPETRARRTLDALDRTGVQVAVINRRPFFSDPVGPELVAGLQARYPMAREVGRFLVVWRSSAPPAEQSATPAEPPATSAGPPPSDAAPGDTSSLRDPVHLRDPS